MQTSNYLTGFMVAWRVTGEEQTRLYEALKLVGGWSEGTIGGGAGNGRLLDKEFGVSVKWGQSMVTGGVLDALFASLGKKPKSEPMMPNEMWKEALAFATTYIDASPEVKPTLHAFVLAAVNEGGYEKVGEFEGDKPKLNPVFLETLAQHK